MNLNMFLQAETLLYHDFTFGFSHKGLSEDFSAKILLSGRKSQSRGLEGKGKPIELRAKGSRV